MEKFTQQRTLNSQIKHMTKKEKILLFLLAGINFTHIMDFMIIMPLGNYITQKSQTIIKKPLKLLITQQLRC